VGNQATSSLEPMTGKTSKSPEAFNLLFAQLVIAARSSGVPAVTG
jgi:hypothetical protein